MPLERSHSPSQVLSYGGVFVALLAMGAQISIPLPFTLVPLSLQSLILLFLAASTPPKTSGFITASYLLLGLVGVPVFTGFSGGPQKLFGPTGGFIIGFLPAVMLLSYLLSQPFGSSASGKITALIVFHLVLYTFGILWFVPLMSATVPVALHLCVLPFLPGDALKSLIFYTLYPQLSKRMPQRS